MRIIGIEWRLRYCHPKVGWQQQEVAVIPCDIELQLMPLRTDYPDTIWHYSARMNGTLHTAQGDIAIPEFVIDEGQFNEFDRGLRFRSGNLSPSPR